MITFAQTIALAGLGTWLCQLVFVLMQNQSFAIISNLMFCLVAVLRVLDSTHISEMLVGQLGGGAFPLALLGAASFAFHQDTASSNKHTLDIFMTSILVSHVLYVSTTISLIGLLPLVSRKRLRRFISNACGFAYIVSIFLLSIYYHTIYANQSGTYIVLGTLTILATVTTRLLLLLKTKSLTVPVIFTTAAEIIVAIVVLLSAVVCQGEILGSTLPMSSADYDLYHGMWHVQLAVLTGLLYSRLADASETIRKNAAVDIKPNYLELFGLFILFVQAVVLMVLKETRVTIKTSKQFFFAYSFLYLVYALIVFVATLRSTPSDEGDKTPLNRANSV